MSAARSVPGLYFRKTALAVCPSCKASTRPKSSNYVDGLVVISVTCYVHAKARTVDVFCTACAGRPRSKLNSFRIEDFTNQGAAVDAYAHMRHP